jgi:His-Xaa-Ser system radical SAM maturase HxsC
MKLAAHGHPSPHLRQRVIGRIAFETRPLELRADTVLVTLDPRDQDLAGYVAVLTPRLLDAGALEAIDTPLVHGIEAIEHLASGDVVALNPSGHVRTLYRIASRHNTLFATDRCNSLCLMCSQPPKEVDDSQQVRELVHLVELMSSETEELGITGGEPTLLGDGLLDVVRRCKTVLPRTALHILSNGRLFYYGAYARHLAEIAHPDLMVGIPLYSDVDCEHDYVVQSRGAFDETMIGLHNLGRFAVSVEVRVVVHRLTIPRLSKIAEFIFRNVPFAAHVALMGLEPIGLAIPNLDELWIDPWNYKEELEEATLFLAARGMRVSIYNHQLCTLPRSLWPYASRSISDWKNEFLDVCTDCGVKGRCGGFFASSVGRRHSSYIRPIMDCTLRETTQ